MFQPPQSPASSTATLSFATTTDYFSSGPRKRARAGSPRLSDTMPTYLATPSREQCLTPGDGSYTSAAESRYGPNSLLVNDRYGLAGGFDTPSLQATAEAEQMHLPWGNEGRRVRGDAPSLEHAPSGDALSGPLARERNGVARLPSSWNGETTSWTDLAMSLVSKVFSFGGHVIKGFYAGGGQGYSLERSPLQTGCASQPEGCSTPLPGSWQDDAEFLGDFEQDNPHSPPESASRPPNKRRQTDRDTWIMVGTPDATEMSPRRKVLTTNVPRSSLPVPRPSASRASSRRSLIPLPTRPSPQHFAEGSYTGSPAQLPANSSQARRASFAPMRLSNDSRPNSAGNGNAYISPEAERYVKRRAKQDRQADAAMSDMSRKLTDLIRQGQEALGTRFEVGAEGGGRW